jgi:diguanylate cyclase (GGDEF)-like protein
MSLKSEYAIKFITYTILILTIVLSYLNHQNPINLALLVALGLLVLVLLALQNKNTKKHMILNSIYDTKTKLYNRQYFIAELSTTYERAIRYDSALSLLIIGIDNLNEFKNKDKDIILKEIGNYMLQHSRQSDIVCRYDDERIVMLLPMTDYLHATIAKDRFKNGLLNINFPTEKRPIFRFVATQNSPDEDAEEFLIRAFDGY